MSDLSLVANWLNDLTVSSVENTLVEAGQTTARTAGEIVETVAWVMLF